MNPKAGDDLSEHYFAMGVGAGSGAAAGGFDSEENALSNEWNQVKGKSRLSWEQARSATRAAWDKVERAIPGDFDRNGR